MSEKVTRAEKFSFFLGVVVSCIAFLIFSLVIFFSPKIKERLIGGSKEIRKTEKVQSEANSVIYLPDHILNELTQLDAVFDNANNPTSAKKHDTILVQPHEKLSFTLRPNTTILAYVLKTGKAFNIDPPVLYLRSEENLKSSPVLRDYIDSQTRLHYSYTINENGFRTTLPIVKADRKILIIGDSVAFGAGVNDDSTTASYLQSMVGESYRVVNAGVGSYTARQAFWMAEILSAKESYDVLIFLTSQNDFMFGHKTFSYNAEGRLKELAALKPNFPKGMMLVVFPYMEYSLRDIILDKYWPQQEINLSKYLFKDLPSISKKIGITYIDLTSMIDTYLEQTATVFSRFVFYVDHGHMSPYTSQLVAAKIFESLKKQGVTP